MKLRLWRTAVLMTAMSIAASLSMAQEVIEETISGVTNFARVETTVACAGAIQVEAVPKIKKMGYASIVNLREASEPGANVEAEEAAAKAAGIRFYHIPFNGASPDPAAAGKFLDAITSKDAEPAFIHCSRGNRAATMWLIKRLAVDHWDVDRATNEATDLGLTSSALKQFAIDYAQAHRR